MVLSALTLCSFGQLDTLKKKQTPLTKKQVLKEKFTPQAPAVKETPVPEKLPDLRFTDLVVRHTGSRIVNGVEQNTFNISFTVINEGTAPADRSKIIVQGYIGYDPNWPQTIPACGLTLGTNGILSPGSSASGVLGACILGPLNRNNNPFYTIYVDHFNNIKESNEQNNSAKKSLLFEYTAN